MNLVYLNWCRLCASSSENSVPIFEEDGLSNFAEKIKSYLHVDITNTNDTNDVPRMCNSCSEKILTWDQYAEKVQKVQGMFMSLTASGGHNELLQKLSEELGTVKDKDDQRKVISCDIVSEVKESDDKRLSGCIQVRKQSKPKKGVGGKKAKPALCNDADFSEEDDLPLSLQVNCLDETVKNRLGNAEGTQDREDRKTVHKTKLKVKTVKDNGAIETVQNADTGENEAESRLNEEDSSSSSKDGNSDKTTGVHSLFTWECLECQASVKNWNALVKHCREEHDSNAAVLCICGKQLQSRTSIMKHRMKHTVGYGYQCDYENCNKTFHRQQLLDVHILSHMPKELQPWMCCKCSRRFHTESLLKQHEKVHLPKEEKLIHPCEVCQKRFCSKSAVAAHIRAVHFGERPFVCDQCGHSFTSKGILHEHLTIHSDVYNFHCKDCNKSFKTKYRLKIHMDTHVETRYQCPICTLTLNTRRTLRMHLLVHRDDKAFQCTTCGKAFKRSKDLKNHYNLHTGRRPYTCPFCLRTFANGSNCRSHKRRMHPEELKLYEAAIAAGQQPVIFRAGDDPGQEKTPQDQGNAEEYLDDSNDSEESETVPKYSDEEEKPKNSKFVTGTDAGNVVGTAALMDSNPFQDKLINANAIPLNLQRNCFKKIKEEDEEDIVQTFALTGDENISSNIVQIAYANQSQPLRYPIQHMYSFQSGGIPAFPGNPFFRQ